jgi:hypothetical protein
MIDCLQAQGHDNSLTFEFLACVASSAIFAKRFDRAILVPRWDKSPYWLAGFHEL